MAKVDSPTMKMPTTASNSLLLTLLAVAFFGLVFRKFYIARRLIWEKQKKGLVRLSHTVITSLLLNSP